jgi:PIN domain nuclease of toxin-antitoxin system
LIYLCDTNVIIKYANGEAMPPATQAVLQADATQILVSAASSHEIFQKIRIGKLAPLAVDIASLYRGFDAAVTAVEHEDFIISAQLDWYVKDPFDRIIAAQTMRLRIPLISSDRHFDALPLTRIWS